MQITEFKIVNKGALKATFNVVIPEWGLTIRDCKDFESNGRNWIGYPARSYDDPETGKKKYFNYIQFEEKVKERFEVSIKKELEKHWRENSNDKIFEEIQVAPF